MVKIGKLFKFYKAIGHLDVIDLIEENVGRDIIEKKFDIYEHNLYKLYIPKNLGDRKLPILTAHTDTVWNEKPKKFKIIDKNIVMNKRQDRGLGADCRNGCYIISEVMRSHPEDFIFILFDLEEIGGIGSGKIADNLLKKLKENTNIIIGLDCFDDGIVACYDDNNKYSLSNKSNDDFKFLEFLENNGWKEDGGYFTDAYNLMRKLQLPAFVLSIGFTNQHTSEEYSDLDAVSRTTKILRRLRRECFNENTNLTIG